MSALKCSICGRFISDADLLNGAAVNRMVTADSHLTSEEWDTYHKACEVIKEAQ